MTDLTGRKLGKYTLEARLGAGGMAAVFRSRHPQFDKPVAIKILPPSVGQDTTFQARFEREGRTIAALNHPNIIRVYDIDESDGLFYMVMDLLPGGTLEGRIHQGQVDRRWSVETIITVAEALEYAHSRGVIHRDIKPSNILLNEENQPVLADFGIARLLDPGEAQLTATGTVVGTLAYMAPEQLNGQSSDARADIYSLGVVLYQMLVGRVPFTGDTMTIISGHLTKEPPPLHEFAPDIPQAMEEVVLQALAKNPDHRFRSARVFAQALRNTLAELEPGMVDVASAARAQTPPSFGGVQLPTATRPNGSSVTPQTGIPLPPAPNALAEYARRYWMVAVGALVVLVVLERVARMRVGDLLGIVIFVAVAWFGYTYWRSRNPGRSLLPPSTGSTIPLAPPAQPAATVQLTEEAPLAATSAPAEPLPPTLVSAASPIEPPPPTVTDQAAPVAADEPTVAARVDPPAPDNAADPTVTDLPDKAP